MGQPSTPGSVIENTIPVSQISPPMCMHTNEVNADSSRMMLNRGFITINLPMSCFSNGELSNLAQPVKRVFDGQITSLQSTPTPNNKKQRINNRFTIE